MKTKLWGVVSICLIGGIGEIHGLTKIEREMNVTVNAIKSADPAQLNKMIRDMPKGGDLHNHLNGASYAENMIQYAKHDNLCIDPSNQTVSVDPNCKTNHKLQHAIANRSFYLGLIKAWSMHNFQSGTESGAQHFFNSFPKFSIIAKMHRGELLAEVAERAAADNTSYLELMSRPDGYDAAMLGKTVGWDPDFNQTFNKIRSHKDFEKILRSSSQVLEQAEEKKSEQLGCHTKRPKPGCNVSIRYLYEALREQPPEFVFAQLILGFELTQRNKRVVGIDLVQPEFGPLSMRDYHLHMQFIRFLHKRYPNVKISLHAGELTEAVTSKDGLRFHINDAVTIAHADRIGHGVDIAEENHHDELLRHMAKQHVLVEINLTSNAYVLGIDGPSHPLALYLNSGVPIAFSTDDPGVFRTNLSQEFMRAITHYQLDYTTLKQAARNSLAYSFVAGKPLWIDTHYQQPNAACSKESLGNQPQTTRCQAFLKNNEKAALQWDLEGRFNRFEKQYAH